MAYLSTGMVGLHSCKLGDDFLDRQAEGNNGDWSRLRDCYSLLL
jgi:hypothetical protein